MPFRSRIATSVVAIAVVTVGGTTGYLVIEGWSFLDAFYMTVVTVTTVGYSEVRPLSSAGRIFSIFLMVGGIGVIFYILTSAVRTVIEEEYLENLVQRRRMKTQLSRLSEHYILCGYGRVGTEVTRALGREGVNFVVVDNDTVAIAQAHEEGFLYVQGNATENETLRLAGIADASGLMVVTGSDSDNVFVTLSARSLNPKVHIVARSADPATSDKLRIAGADRVVSPYAIGGRRIALSAIRPLAVDFFDTMLDGSRRGVRMTEVEVAEGSPMAGAKVGAFTAANDVQVLAIAKQPDDLVVTPGGDITMEPGDHVMLAGRDAELVRLEGKDGASP
jgi:voltage-gated potassium channel